MKIITAFVFNIVFGALWAQDRPAPPPSTLTYQEISQEAQFPGGKVGLTKYLIDSLVYPPDAIENALTGKCYLRFDVSATGKVANVRVVRGVPECQSCNDEAMRVVAAMPDWIPAYNDKGEAVKSYYILPISFQQSDPEPVEEPAKPEKKH